MKTLAEVVVSLLEHLTTAEEPGIDYQSCGDITNDVWGETLRHASATERQALSAAATARLSELLREPDEFGYTPRALVTPLRREFLQSLADESAWDEFDNPKAAKAEDGAEGQSVTEGVR